MSIWVGPLWLSMIFVLRGVVLPGLVGPVRPWAVALLVGHGQGQGLLVATHLILLVTVLFVGLELPRPNGLRLARSRVLTEVPDASQVDGVRVPLLVLLVQHRALGVRIAQGRVARNRLGLVWVQIRGSSHVVVALGSLLLVGIARNLLHHRLLLIWLLILLLLREVILLDSRISRIALNTWQHAWYLLSLILGRRILIQVDISRLLWLQPKVLRILVLAVIRRVRGWVIQFHHSLGVVLLVGVDLMQLADVVLGLRGKHLVLAIGVLRGT